MKPTLPLGLYAIADATYGDPIAQARSLLAAGLGVVQLRCKGWSTAERVQAARALRADFDTHHAILIMNDDLEAAAEGEADGLHLGQGDGELAAARARLGEAALIGRSTHSLRHIDVARAEGADYIGFGPLFETRTKETPNPTQAALLEAALAAAGATPLVGIGGLDAERLVALRARGLQRWAVISAILLAPDLAQAVVAHR
jgi:thiamine-phosphate pyrophosphorylase